MTAQSMDEAMGSVCSVLVRSSAATIATATDINAIQTSGEKTSRHSTDLVCVAAQQGLAHRCAVARSLARESIMRCRILILFVSMMLPASDAALAGCAEDLTRIQLALPNAAPDLQSRIGGLLSDAP